MAKEYIATHFEKAEDYTPYLLDVLTAEHLTDRGHNTYDCPFCGSGQNGNHNTPAFHYYPQTDTFCCFACADEKEAGQRYFGGNVITYIKHRYNINSTREAMAKIDSLLGLMPNMERRKKQKATEQTIKENRAEINQAIQHASDTDYFYKRAFTDDLVNRFGLGFKPDEGIVTIPCNAQKTYSLKRYVDPENKLRYKNDAGESVELFNADALKQEKYCFICEGAFDALSVYQVQMTAETDLTNAIGLNGTGNSKLLLDTIDELQKNGEYKSKCLILNLDSDDSGIKAQESLKQELEKRSIQCINSTYKADVTDIDFKDLNELLVYDKEHGTDNAYAHVHNNFYNAKWHLEDAEEHPERNKALRPVTLNLLSETAPSFFIDIKNRRTVSTGFTNVDKILGAGLERGVTFIGGNSSIGKTTFLLQMAENISRQHERVMYLSYEMSRTELEAKIMSRHTFNEDIYKNEYLMQKSPNSLTMSASTAQEILNIRQHSKYSENKLNNIYQANQELYENNYLELYEDALTFEKIINLLDLHKQYYTKDPAPVVFVDFLQAMPPLDDHATEYTNVSNAVSKFRDIAREYNTIVVCLLSVARDKYYKPLSLDMGKGNGNIEYGADVILGLQAHEIYDGMNEEQGKKALSEHKSKTPRQVILKNLKQRLNVTEQIALFNYYSAYDFYKEDGTKSIGQWQAEYVPPKKEDAGNTNNSASGANNKPTKNSKQKVTKTYTRVTK